MGFKSYDIWVLCKMYAAFWWSIGSVHPPANQHMSSSCSHLFVENRLHIMCHVCKMLRLLTWDCSPFCVCLKMQFPTLDLRSFAFTSSWRPGGRLISLPQNSRLFIDAAPLLSLCPPTKHIRCVSVPISSLSPTLFFIVMNIRRSTDFKNL